jgi:NAD(P)-dependent dehydrogenase (short-subunit alcohol dehydrogenase family)
VVTGGSTGIGLAIARALLDEGAMRVYVTGRSEQSLSEAVRALGKRAVAVVSDVAKLSDLEKLKATIEGHDDKVDALFANAGIAGNNVLGDTEETDYMKIFDINVKGVFFSVQTLLPLLKDGSSVVLTSSIVNNKGMENLSLYSATKAAVRSFARTWANDLKGREIRVNSLSPGFTQTPILKSGLKMDEQQIVQFKEFAAGAVPAGYIAQPEEIASTALFLASVEARYVNGVDLAVDGGYAQV